LNEVKFQERVTPLKDHTAVFQSHYATYKFAVQFVKGMKVLDAASGTGYGSALLSQYCDSCVGIDLSSEAIAYARNNYKAGNLGFFVMDLMSLGFQNESFGVACSFQAIEHVKDCELHLSEISRVLSPDGLFLLSTPNKDFSLSGASPVLNIYHVKEFTLNELDRLLRRYFNSVEIFGQSLDKNIRSSLEQNPLKKQVARFDVLNLRKMMSSWCRRRLANASGTLVEEDISFKDFVISKDDLRHCENFVAVCKDKI